MAELGVGKEVRGSFRVGRSGRGCSGGANGGGK